MVDWLAQVPAGRLWAQQRLTCCCWPASCSPALLIWLHALCKYQGLAGNFAMRLRWNFHRHLLWPGMGFYQDEFAGRQRHKVMQSALAVRDTILICSDIMVFVVIYFVTMTAVVGHFDRADGTVPVLAGVVPADAAVLRAARAAPPKRQADARSLMTGRITDATPISAPSNCSHKASARPVSQKRDAGSS